MFKKIGLVLLFILSACSDKPKEEALEAKEFRNIKVEINDEIKDYDLQYVRDFKTNVIVTATSQELKNIKADDIFLYLDINHDTISLGSNNLKILNKNPNLNLSVKPDTLKVVASQPQYYLPNFDLESVKLANMKSFATISKIPQTDHAYFLTTGIIETKNSDYYLKLDEKMFENNLVSDLNYDNYDKFTNGLEILKDYQDKNIIFTVLPLYISDLSDFKTQLSEYEVPLYQGDKCLGKVRLDEIIQTITKIEAKSQEFVEKKTVKVGDDLIFNFKGIDFQLPFNDNLLIEISDNEVKINYLVDDNKIEMKNYLVSDSLLFANLNNYFYSKPIYQNDQGMRVVEKKVELNVDNLKDANLIKEYYQNLDSLVMN